MNPPSMPSVSGATPTGGNSTALGAGVAMPPAPSISSPAPGADAAGAGTSHSPVAGTGGIPGAVMMIPSGLAASQPAAAGMAAPHSPDSPTRFQDAVVQWAILQRLDSIPEVTSMPDEETARRRFIELSESAQQQAPTEPQRWPQLLSGRITWTQVR